MSHREQGPAGPPEPTMAERLLSSDRERWADSAVVLALLGLAPNAKVADIGCGPGYYSLQLARAASQGRVHALDVDEEMVALCRQRISDAGIDNVSINLCGDYDFGLEAESLDLVFLSCVVHHAEDRVRFLEAGRRALKATGRCAMLEWEARESESGPPLERRIAREELQELAEAAGYCGFELHALSEHQYLLLAAPA